MIKTRNPIAALAGGVLAVGLLSASMQLSADTIFGLHAGAHIWQPDVSGNVGQTANAFDFSSEFDDGSSDSQSVYLAVEHFIPLIPNVLARRTGLQWGGQSQNAQGTLGAFTFSGQVDADIDITMFDATLYYEILDNWVSVDIGLTARNFDGFVNMREINSGQSEKAELDYTIPMLYGHARFDLPFSGLAAGARGNIISYQDNQIADFEAYVHLEADLLPTIDVGIEGGLRRVDLDIVDLDDWNSDVNFNGAYVALTAHF